MEELETPAEGARGPEPDETRPEEIAQDEPAPETPDAGGGEEAPPPDQQVSMEELLGESAPETERPPADVELRAVIEAIVYVAEEPLTLTQLAGALAQPEERIRAVLDELMAEWERPEHGVAIRQVAGGYKMATKAEHHEAVRSFVKSLKPPLKLSLPALETLAVIAYKQPVTAPEIMEIRGVQGAGVLKTLLDRKLIAVAGRKNVIGKPMLYKTTKDFLIQFGLKDLSELPSLKEFEEIRRMAFADSEPETPAETAPETAPAAAEQAPPAEAATPEEAPGTPEASEQQEPATEET